VHGYLVASAMFIPVDAGLGAPDFLRVWAWNVRQQNGCRRCRGWMTGWKSWTLPRAAATKDGWGERWGDHNAEECFARRHRFSRRAGCRSVARDGCAVFARL